jgi:hypothetical protein
MPHPGYGRIVDQHGYPEATVAGFKIGMFVSYGDCGDAWVEAPDGGIGTLIWETGEPPYFEESIPPDPKGRWGTFAVQQPLPLTTDDEAAEYLRSLLPELRARWEEWRKQRDL